VGVLQLLGRLQRLELVAVAEGQIEEAIEVVGNLLR